MNAAHRDGHDATDTHRVVLLADASFAIPVLAKWFVEEWGPWYGPDGRGDARADLFACCNRERFPLAVRCLYLGSTSSASRARCTRHLRRIESRRRESGAPGKGYEVVDDAPGQYVRQR